MKETKKSKKHSSVLSGAVALYKPSWTAFKRNIDTFALQILFSIGIVVLASIFMQRASSGGPLSIATFLAFGVALALGLHVTTALIITELRSAEDKKYSFDQSLKDGFRYFWRMGGLVLVCAALIVVGFVLFIVPGLFALQRLLMAPYILVDQNTSIVAAVRKSFTVGKRHAGPIWGVTWLLIGINLVSFIAHIGWVIAIALSILYLCAPAVRYIQLKNLR